MVGRQPKRALRASPGLALHGASARVESLLKERERLLREVSRRKRLIEQARAKGQREGQETAGKLGPLFLRQQGLARELTALFDELLSEERSTRARNVLGKLRASLEQRGFLAPALDDSDDSQPASQPPPRPNGRAGTEGAAREVASARQPDPERRNAREIFRSLARTIHPDQARDEGERVRRTEVMKELTRAHEAGDLARLLELECEWQGARVPAPGEGDAEARCQETERTNRELLKQVRRLTRELRDVKDETRHASFGSVAKSARELARALGQMEALCELVRDFKGGKRTLAELALAQSLL